MQIPKRIPESIKKNILNILLKNNLESSHDIRRLLLKRLEKEENNLILICKDSLNRSYILKYSLTHLIGKRHTGVRGLFNVKNEIQFYVQVRGHRWKKLVIPELLDASSRRGSYLILRKLNTRKTVLFPEDTFFRKNFLPMSIIKPIINGMSEFQSKKINKKLFHYMTMKDVYPWIDSLEGAYSGKIKHIRKNVYSLVDKYSKLWDLHASYLLHGDIEGDTFGYEKGSNKLVLLDFEKVQIGHPSHDFAFFLQNPREESWNKTFETEFFNAYKKKDFHILLTLSRLIKTLTCLNNFKTGRIDHVFIGILGTRKKYNTMKKVYIPLWEEEALRLIKSI